jgi:hypothetical protein
MSQYYISSSALNYASTIETMSTFHLPHEGRIRNQPFISVTQVL